MNAISSSNPSPATVAVQLSNLDTALANASAAGVQLPQDTRENLVATVEEAMATRFVVAEGDDAMATQLNQATQPHHKQALAIARTLAVHDGRTNANPFEHDQLKRAYDSEFRFNQRFLAEPVQDAAAATTEPTTVTDDRERRRAAGIEMAKDAGVADPARLVDLAMRTAAAEKDSEAYIVDPDTGHALNAQELAELMDHKHIGRQLSDQDKEFSRRRGYTEAEIQEFEEFVSSYWSAVDQGADEGSLQYALHVASGAFEIPLELQDEGVPGFDSWSPLDMPAAPPPAPVQAAVRAKLYLSPDRSAVDYATDDPELIKAFAHEAVLTKFAEARVPDANVRQRFMAVQRERIAGQLASGNPLPEVRIKEAISHESHDAAERE